MSFGFLRVKNAKVGNLSFAPDSLEDDSVLGVGKGKLTFLFAGGSAVKKAKWRSFQVAGKVPVGKFGVTNKTEGVFSLLSRKIEKMFLILCSYWLRE